MANDILAALEPVVDALESLGVRYGVPRSTLDVDVACELRLEHVASFVDRLADSYYVDGDMIGDAIRRRSSFNVIHLATMLKVDVFVRKGCAFEEQSFERVVQKPLDDTPGARSFDITTAEDIILHKLEWFQLGERVSERQWKDVVGVIAVQGAALDFEHLRKWSRVLGVEELLEQALAAGAAMAPG